VLARHGRRHLHPFGRADKAADFDHMAEHFHADEGIHLNRSLQESIGVILPGLSKDGRQNGVVSHKKRSPKAKKPAFQRRRAWEIKLDAAAAARHQQGGVAQPARSA
jgi:hypothetical protein